MECFIANIATMNEYSWNKTNEMNTHVFYLFVLGFRHKNVDNPYHVRCVRVLKLLENRTFLWHHLCKLEGFFRTTDLSFYIPTDQMLKMAKWSRMNCFFVYGLKWDLFEAHIQLLASPNMFEWMIKANSKFKRVESMAWYDPAKTLNDTLTPLFVTAYMGRIKRNFIQRDMIR